MKNNDIQQLAIAVLKAESQSILDLTSQINDAVVTACHAILNNKGHVIVTGMGKSGHIGNKIAATLASTGTPAFFLHPGEASHGDLGMIVNGDLIIALSNSGETAEIIALLPALKRLNITLISITNDPNSTLSIESDIALNTNVTKEACPLGLAPTSSTTAALALGDALAISLLESRGFTEQDFALSHPGGSLGRKLLLHVDNLMHPFKEVPKVSATASIQATLLEMTEKGFGMTAIIDKNKCILGIYTDGDLRRTLERNINLQNTAIQDVMTKNCKTISTTILAEKALQIMEENKITVILVSDKNNTLLGIIHMHDLLKAGVI